MCCWFLHIWLGFWLYSRFHVAFIHSRSIQIKKLRCGDGHLSILASWLVVRTYGVWSGLASWLLDLYHLVGPGAVISHLGFLIRIKWLCLHHYTLAWRPWEAVTVNAPLTQLDMQKPTLSWERGGPIMYNWSKSLIYLLRMWAVQKTWQLWNIWLGVTRHNPSEAVTHPTRVPVCSQRFRYRQITQ